MKAQVFFGGTFDPPHIGHLIIASEVMAAVPAEQLVFVPVARNPFKDEGPEATGRDRIEMLRRLASGDSRFTVSSHEIERPAPSRTFDTVTSMISAGTLSEEPWMVVGDDLVPGLLRWYRGEELLQMVRLAVVCRQVPLHLALPSGGSPDRSPEKGRQSVVAELRHVVEQLTDRFVIVLNPYIGISSREIRRRLHEKKPVRYLVPDTVYDYIQENSLYQ